MLAGHDIGGFRRFSGQNCGFKYVGSTNVASWVNSPMFDGMSTKAGPEGSKDLVVKIELLPGNLGVSASTKIAIGQSFDIYP